MSAEGELPAAPPPADSSACLLDERIPINALAASLPGCICSFRLRPDGTTAMPYASPAIMDIYGLRPEDVAHDAAPIMARVHPADAAAVRAAIAESARTMTQWHAEWRIHDSQKGERWIEGHSMPVAEADGSVLWHGYIHDVTERKAVELRHGERTAFLRLLMDAVPALISYIDADLRYRKVNRGYENWFGRTSEEVEGRQVRDVLGDEAWERVAPYMQRALAGEAQHFEREIPYRDGGSRWVHASYLPDFDNAGRTRGFVVMVVDLSENRRMSEELQQSHQKFVELLGRQDGIREAERRHVAREVHDELGQLLTGMRLTLSAMRRRATDSTAGDVMQTAQQLERMLDDTADVVRRISKSLHATAIEHGLLEALEGLATEFRDTTGLDCRLTVSGKPRPIGEPQLLTLYRIAQESLTNIARHAAAKSVHLRLEFEPTRVRLAIGDDGCGFDYPAAMRNGSGLGLFGMKERAAMSGGSLRVSSSPGGGTRVEVELPATDEAGS